jgi:hypothetical protein
MQSQTDKRQDCWNKYVQFMGAYVGSGVLRAVVMKCSSFWDIKPCSPLKAGGSGNECLASTKC